MSQKNEHSRENLSTGLVQGARVRDGPGVPHARHRVREIIRSVPRAPFGGLFDDTINEGKKHTHNKSNKYSTYPVCVTLEAVCLFVDLA